MLNCLATPLPLKLKTMNKLILNAVALRYRALYLGINREDINMTSEVSAPVIAFVARLKENGFSVSEELLHALCAVSANGHHL